jgi:hypothetical protein
MHESFWQNGGMDDRFWPGRLGSLARGFGASMRRITPPESKYNLLPYHTDYLIFSCPRNFATFSSPVLGFVHAIASFSLSLDRRVVCPYW